MTRPVNVLDWRSFAGLIAAPLAWMIDHQAGSDLNFSDCRTGDAAVLLSIGGAALAVAVIGGAVSVVAWRRAGGAPDTSQEAIGRFIAALSVMASGLLSLTLVMQMMAALAIPPCFR
jgi:hypothetical protein